MNTEAFAGYIRERESIRVKRAAGLPSPWTKDPILHKYKFTNVHREDDAATKRFKAIYDKNINAKTKPEVTLLNCTIARYFGTFEFMEHLGWLNDWNDDVAKSVIQTARARLGAGARVFTGAYVITNCGRTEPKEVVVCDFIGSMWKRAPMVMSALKMRRSWEAAYDVLKTVPGFGGSGFMSKEVLQDVLLTRFGKDADDALTWSPVGPGARRGINRLQERDLHYGGGKEAFWVAELMAVQGAVNAELIGTGIKPLSAHDVQFCLCEFDKYERVRLGQGRPRSTYHHPKPKK